jgi:hypothetical protein
MHEKYTRLSQFASPLALGVIRLAAVTGVRLELACPAMTITFPALPRQAASLNPHRIPTHAIIPQSPSLFCYIDLDPKIAIIMSTTYGKEGVW